MAVLTQRRCPGRNSRRSLPGAGGCATATCGVSGQGGFTGGQFARVTFPLAGLRNRIVGIPLLGSISAGLPEQGEQDPEGCVSVAIESLGFKPTRNTFAVRVRGDSMIGRHLLNGDIIVLEHGPEPRHGQIVAALVDGASTLKTFLVKGGRPFLRAENPKYPALIPAQELVIQGVFKALIRMAKE